MKIYKDNLKKGFTLIEIMVVIALFATLSAISLGSGYRQNQIRNSLLTDSVDLAISLQDMQTRSSSFISSNENSNSVGYGLFFDSMDPGNIQSFYKSEGQFSSVDVPNISVAKPDQDLILNYGNKVGKICLNGCSNFNSNNTKLAIFFIKPKPYANFSVLDTNGVTYATTINASGTNVQIVHACLEIDPTSGNEYRHVDIYKVGQISSAYGPCE